jgi:intraflagellar transport protein 52
MYTSNEGGGNEKIESKQSPVEKTILFDASKRETHHPGSGFKKLFRRLRGSNKVAVNKDELGAVDFTSIGVLVLGCPREKFSTLEFDKLKQFLNNGGSILFFGGEGGEASTGTNFSYLTEEYGISMNSDCVVRTVYHKYTHPKEALISSGVLSRKLVKAKDALSKKGRVDATNETDAPSPSRDNYNSRNSGSDHKQTDGLTFVYPNGCTLNVAKPAVPLLSSGFVAYPLNRPVLAVSNVIGAEKKIGKICVLGSAAIFSDDWLLKEENNKLQDILFKWLNGHAAVGDLLERVTDDAEFNEKYDQIPDIEALSERLRSCLQESEEVSKNLTTLFEDDLFSFTTNIIPEAVNLYGDLRVKHEPLSLIPPQFECPQPDLQPAVFPPALREPPPPALDQFDLDEHFASEKIRLAQLTNKCTDEDLDYYVREAGDILGATKDLPLDKIKHPHLGSKYVLHHIFQQIVNFKKLDQGNNL